MKRDTLKVGSKLAARTVNGQTVSHFVCGFNRPETVADCMKLAADKESVVVAQFVRGYTIKLQDSIGRPLFEAGETQEAIQSALDSFQLGTTQAIGRPSKPKTVEVEAKKSYSLDEVKAILARGGITATIQQ